MKKIYCLLATCLLTLQLFAQAPQRLSFQAIIRNANNVLVTNAPIKMRISILQGSITGTAVYTELHSATTNANGVAFVEVGGGTSPTGNFSTINWGQGPFFLRSETDPNNGINYTIVGTTQLLSVPYALQSNRAARADSATHAVRSSRADSATAASRATRADNATRADSAARAGRAAVADNGLPPTSIHGELRLYQCNGKVQYTPCLPLVVTTPLSGITGFGAASGGNVTSEGGVPVTARGVVWSTAVNPTVALTTRTSNGTGAGSYASSLTNLTPNTLYYVRAYATNSAGTAYGNELSFRTGRLPVVTTTAISSITATTANGGGNVSDSGTASVTARGIVWSTSQNPTIALTTRTSNGIGVGSFTSSITGLSPDSTYFVRAYATNSVGTAYGNEVSFTTLRPTASLTALSCSTATHIGTLNAGIVASGVNSVVAYTGGNGGTYAAQTISSTGVTGLTATLTAGTLANGSGTLTYTITGMPATSGTASFALSIGGQTCTLTRTVNASTPNTVTDASNNTYPTVTIGTQVWMAENLRTTKYRDGSNIPVVANNTQWVNNLNTGATSPMMCWYNNDQATYTANKFGALYNWYAINPATNGNKNVCPTGWHVPTDAEWTTLINFLDPNANGGNNSNTVGGKMKSTGTQFWTSPNTGATNSSGWSGLPGGLRANFGTFDGIGTNGGWWSSTEDATNDAWSRYLDYSYGDVRRNYFNKSSGFSVRCLRD